MLLGISPVTGSRLDALADGILSRPITRYEYLLASWAARVVTVLAVFFLVITPCVLLATFAKRPRGGRHGDLVRLRSARRRWSAWC